MASNWQIEPYANQAGRERFNCGNPVLDRYLREHASQQARRGIAAPVVALHPIDRRIVGFYTLSSSLVTASDLPADVRRGLPRLVPATLLGRLAVDLEFQGRGLGSTLLGHALTQAVNASALVASALMTVDAIDLDAVSFYARFGFKPSDDTALSLFLPLRVAATRQA